MRNGYKLVALTFAGRKRCMEILFSYIEKYMHHIDEYHIYVATENKEDIQYIEAFYEKHNDFVKLTYHPPSKKFNKQNLWDISYTQCKDENTIYLKLDDDIVFMEETLFTDFIDYRIAHPEYILLFPLIINNVITSWYLQEWNLLHHGQNSHIGYTWRDTIRRIEPIVKESINKGIKIGHITQTPEVLCPVSWGSLDFCINAHRTFLQDVSQGNLEKYRGEPFELTMKEPMSIQCCAWFGKELNELTKRFGEVYDDEPWLTIFVPIWSNRINGVYRNSIVSHYSYYIQHHGLEKTDILEQYKSLQK